jgi:hypothetical protein
MNTALYALSMLLAGSLCFAAAQTKDSVAARTASFPDTVKRTVAPLPSAVESDSTRHPGDSLAAPAATAAPASDQSQAQKIQLVKRSYNGRQQILLACGMMVFVLAMFTAAQSWNPR